jgi:hypothetical protein
MSQPALDPGLLWDLEIVCPHCKIVQELDPRYVLSEDELDLITEIPCENCGKMFTLHAVHATAFATEV